MNYRKYELTRKDWLEVLLEAIVLTIVIAFLFYRSAVACVLIIPLFYDLEKKKRQSEKEKQDEKLQEQFLSAIQVVSTALQAGMSMEKAWIEAEKEIKMLYGNHALFYLELVEMNHSVSLNVPIEKLFLQFAGRTDLEDVIWFAEILSYGKRSGGNWRKIITSCVYRMCEKQEAKKQIEIMVAEKKLEQQVMNLIPLGILAFLQFSSWDYMSVMYHNPLGVLCMTVVLIGYVMAIFFSEKILNIRV